MNFKKQLFLLISILFLINSNAQKLELGKVTIEELEEKQHPIEPNASAAILFEKGKVNFEYSQSENGFNMITTVLVKIKIYKKEGYQWANKSIKYYVDTNFKENISFEDAVTYNLVAGKIEKSKLKSDGEFDQKINKYWSLKKIMMPNVKEGCIIEYKYIIKSPNLVSLSDWSFQSSIPVNYSEFKTNIPQYFVYKPNQRGFIYPRISVENKRSSITIDSKERITNNRITSTTFSNDKIEYDETQTTYICQNLPSMMAEDFVNNIDNYKSSISHELTMTRYPNQPYKTYSTDWETVAKKIYEDIDFGNELNKTGYFEDDLVPFLEGVNTRDEKIKAVFKYVKDKMVWNENNGIYCDNGVKKAYKDKTGNVAEINLMLVAMLKHAGIQANPVLLSTKSNGIPVFPNRTAFNYVVAAVEIENDVILLDATSTNTYLNILPSRTHNWVGRLIRDSGSSTDINLMPKKISNDKVMIMANIDPSGTIEGKLREQYFDYIAYFFRENNAKLSEESYIEKLEKRHQGIEIDDYSVANMKDLEKPIVENYSFKHSNLVEIIGDKMYISPMMFFELKENPFKQEKRNFPIDFSIPFNDSYSISLNLPEGYEVEFIPEKINLAMQDDYGFYSFNISSSLKTIQISSTFSINASIVPAQHYMMLKDFYKLMIEKQSEKIVLRKMK